MYIILEPGKSEYMPGRALLANKWPTWDNYYKGGKIPALSNELGCTNIQMSYEVVSLPTISPLPGWGISDDVMVICAFTSIIAITRTKVNVNFFIVDCFK